MMYQMRVSWGHFNMIVNLDKKFIRLIEKLKNEGKVVGFCSGTYDLLHPGHMKHFERAKKLCDILVVAVACDTYVKIRKGHGRPIYNEKQRVYSVDQSKPVDYSFIYKYRTAIDAIKMLKPHCYIRGSDYLTGKSSKEKEFGLEKQTIESFGGVVKYTTSVKPRTTELIELISNRFKK